MVKGGTPWFSATKCEQKAVEDNSSTRTAPRSTLVIGMSVRCNIVRLRTGSYTKTLPINDGAAASIICKTF